MSDEIEIKTGRIVDLLDRDDLGGILLNAQHNFSWITAGASNGIDLSRENGAAMVFVRRDGRRFLLANNIEMPRLLDEQASADDFEPVVFSWQDEKAAPDLIIKKASELADGAIASDIPLYQNTIAIESRIAPCRYDLTPDEIVRFRRLGTDASLAMQAVIEAIEPGETEINIAARMRFELGARNIASVVTLVAADHRIEKYRHPVPTEKIWQKTLMLVTCAKRHGLIASFTRIVCDGTLPVELDRRTQAAMVVNTALVSATRPGATGAELYDAAARAYAEAGFADEINKHHQGGATGYRTRDWVAHPKSNDIVRMNQAFAWNPSITGTKVEETIIVTADGAEVITRSPGEPAAQRSNGQVYGSPQ